MPSPLRYPIYARSPLYSLTLETSPAIPMPIPSRPSPPAASTTATRILHVRLKGIPKREVPRAKAPAVHEGHGPTPYFLGLVALRQRASSPWRGQQGARATSSLLGARICLGVSEVGTGMMAAASPAHEGASASRGPALGLPDGGAGKSYRQGTRHTVPAQQSGGGGGLEKRGLPMSRSDEQLASIFIELTITHEVHTRTGIYTTNMA